jgi:hypothetical protein
MNKGRAIKQAMKLQHARGQCHGKGGAFQFGR